MRIYDVLYAMNTGNASPKARPFDNLLGQALNGGEVEKTTTGNPVSIVTNRAQNAISTLLSFSPKQSGSGDPSPINIRPIEGWTEANLGVNSETPTLTISLGGTYYGFSVDIERGVLRATQVIGDLSVPNWTLNEAGVFVMSSGMFTDALLNFKNGVCTCYEYNGEANSTNAQTIAGRLSDKQMCVFSNSANRGRLVIKDSDVETASELKTSLIGQYIVYPLRTPLELPLTPQTVALLAGNNTLWTDGDEISITYKAKRQ